MENYTQRLQALRSGSALPQKRNGYWQKDDEKELVKMFENNIGISEIALSLERSEVSVVGRILSMGLFEPQCRFRSKKAKGKNESKCKCPDCLCKDCTHYGKDCHETKG